MLLYPVSQKSVATKWRIYKGKINSPQDFLLWKQCTQHPKWLIYKGKIWTPDTSPSTHSISTNSMGGTLTLGGVQGEPEHMKSRAGDLDISGALQLGVGWGEGQNERRIGGNPWGTQPWERAKIVKGSEGESKGSEKGAAPNCGSRK